MQKLYLLCAVIGGTLFLLQWAIALLGIDAHHDFDTNGHGEVHGHDGLFWGILSFRAVVAAVTAFGLGGLATASMGQPRFITLPTAAGCGLGAAFLVAFFLHSVTKLGSDGTSQLSTAVGAAGVVYLTVPGDQKGLGKVQLNHQNRTLEVEAVTYGNELPTGTRVTVTSVVGPNTIEVIAVPEMRTIYEKSDSSPREPARTA